MKTFNIYLITLFLLFNTNFVYAEGVFVEGLGLIEKLTNPPTSCGYGGCDENIFDEPEKQLDTSYEDFDHYSQYPIEVSVCKAILTDEGDNHINPEKYSGECVKANVYGIIPISETVRPYIALSIGSSFKGDLQAGVNFGVLVPIGRIKPFVEGEMDFTSMSAGYGIGAVIDFSSDDHDDFLSDLTSSHSIILKYSEHMGQYGEKFQVFSIGYGLGF